jgi:uncharacterized membrane protein
VNNEKVSFAPPAGGGGSKTKNSLLFVPRCGGMELIMFNRVWFKDLAKEQIKPNLGPLALVLLIFLGISFALGMVIEIGVLVGMAMDGGLESGGAVTALFSLIGTALMYIILGPLLLGIQKVYLGLTHGETPKASDIFYAFSSSQLFWGAVRLYFLMSLFIALWLLLFIVPGIIRSIDYMQAFYLLIENPEKTARECLKESIFLTRGHRGDIFVTQLSFILWSFTSMIPIVGVFIVYGYVYPYIMTTMANIHRFLLDEKYGNSPGFAPQEQY